MRVEIITERLNQERINLSKNDDSVVERNVHELNFRWQDVWGLVAAGNFGG